MTEGSSDDEGTNSLTKPRRVSSLGFSRVYSQTDQQDESPGHGKKKKKNKKEKKVLKEKSAIKTAERKGVTEGRAQFDHYDRPVRTGRWSKEEDDTLKEAFEAYAKRNFSSLEEAKDAILLQGKQGGKQSHWKEIGVCLPLRPLNSIKVRAKSLLLNSVKKGAWTDEEKRTLARLQAVHGNQWAKINKLAGWKRSNIAIKDCWRNIKHRKDLLPSSSSSSHQYVKGTGAWKGRSEGEGAREKTGRWGRDGEEEGDSSSSDDDAGGRPRVLSPRAQKGSGRGSDPEEGEGGEQVDEDDLGLAAREKSGVKKKRLTKGERKDFLRVYREVTGCPSMPLPEGVRDLARQWGLSGALPKAKAEKYRDREDFDEDEEEGEEGEHRERKYRGKERKGPYSSREDSVSVWERVAASRPGRSVSTLKSFFLWDYVRGANTRYPGIKSVVWRHMLRCLRRNSRVFGDPSVVPWTRLVPFWPEFHCRYMMRKRLKKREAERKAKGEDVESFKKSVRQLHRKADCSSEERRVSDEEMISSLLGDLKTILKKGGSFDELPDTYGRYFRGADGESDGDSRGDLGGFHPEEEEEMRREFVVRRDEYLEEEEGEGMGSAAKPAKKTKRKKEKKRMANEDEADTEEREGEALEEVFDDGPPTESGKKKGKRKAKKVPQSDEDEGEGFDAPQSKFSSHLDERSQKEKKERKRQRRRERQEAAAAAAAAALERQEAEDEREDDEKLKRARKPKKGVGGEQQVKEEVEEEEAKPKKKKRKRHEEQEEEEEEEEEEEVAGEEEKLKKKKKKKKRSENEERQGEEEERPKKKKQKRNHDEEQETPLSEDFEGREDEEEVDKQSKKMKRQKKAKREDADDEDPQENQNRKEKKSRKRKMNGRSEIFESVEDVEEETAQQEEAAEDPPLPLPTQPKKKKKGKKKKERDDDASEEHHHKLQQDDHIEEEEEAWGEEPERGGQEEEDEEMLPSPPVSSFGLSNSSSSSLKRKTKRRGEQEGLDGGDDVHEEEEVRQKTKKKKKRKGKDVERQQGGHREGGGKRRGNEEEEEELNEDRGASFEDQIPEKKKKKKKKTREDGELGDKPKESRERTNAQAMSEWDDIDEEDIVAGGSEFIW
uniref:Myb-like domain-containing protein n=1 Tax=Chromera velia CCMP2878 TaxID=1169474 RepID=A0A0G4I641_9ALVE|eukprot:Cvel_11291.t1-p1 / transcript=Cvel_11291.t1 / gene=Cvel_11291 / organism=Chromera_velia_CCMP2878 / gene_product=Myb-like protein AA, putative / transcript_product=Myb-like protein AA, putative / location=Cvel_scaffold705:20828-27365(-) / protein_length=1112 / sequence_SO=supercontig / SO=protein_coding / is_pseudo=false